MRFLYPVYCISEVELRLSKRTDVEAIETVNGFLERCGKSGFFRSGPHPLVLNDSERAQRRKKRQKLFAINKHLGGRDKSSLITPVLAHAGNFAPPQDDVTNKGDSGRDFGECVVCMDRVRSCVLAPCHHLCSCAECGDMLVKRKDGCPICRRTITNTVKFFRS